MPLSDAGIITRPTTWLDGLGKALGHRVGSSVGVSLDQAPGRMRRPERAML